MSIAPNVGSIASYLSVLRSKPFANFARKTGKLVLDRIPLGGAAKKAIESAELGAMRFISPTEKTAVIFEELGFRYIGPVDGHNFDALVDALRTAAAFDHPVLLHIRTVKGKGYEPAERDSRTFHGVGANAFEPSDGTKKSSAGARPKFQDAFGDAMIAIAEKDPRVVGITAAMPDGTGLSKFGKRFPERYFDVGIAEAHGVCFAAGLASRGLRPVCAIYSTFLQRAYDQIVHDVVVQNLPVVFCMDRAGFVGDDGPTHMGLYDIAYLRTLPNVTLMAPRCEAELAPMLEHALTLNGPAAIRYPRGSTNGKHDDPVAPIVQGKAEVLRRGRRVAILAYGNTVDIALDAYDALRDTEGGDASNLPTVVNARFAKPLDEALLLDLANDHDHAITLEEHSVAGGFGSAVAEFVSDRGLRLAVERVGVANVLVQHDSQDKQRAMFGLTAASVAARVAGMMGIPIAR
jgi:1-deoxy-D-xylulose-5-phosphate synthase